MATPRSRPSSSPNFFGGGGGGATPPSACRKSRPTDGVAQQERPPFLSVAVRVKPAPPASHDDGGPPIAVWVKAADYGLQRQKVCVHRGYMLEEHEFSRAFGPEDDNRRVFEDLQGPSIVSSVFSGVNETLFAYGQTGSGKTHTIFGTGNEAGLLQFFVKTIFTSASSIPGSRLHVCCYEVFGDTLTDLVDATGLLESGELAEEDIVSDELFLKTQKYRYQIVRVTSMAACIELLQGARMNRTAGVSSCNASSSRSHAIVHIFVQNPQGGGSFASGEAQVSNSIGALTLVDLAGAEKEHENPSERGRRSTRLLNTSLSSLNRLLRKLQTNTLDESERRQSVLNKCLWEYLRPGCGIALVFCLSPLLKHREVTLSTIAMATDSKSIHSRRKAQFLCMPTAPNVFGDSIGRSAEEQLLSSPCATSASGMFSTPRNSLGSAARPSWPTASPAARQSRGAGGGSCGSASEAFSSSVRHLNGQFMAAEGGPGTRTPEFSAGSPPHSPPRGQEPLMEPCLAREQQRYHTGGCGSIAEAAQREAEAAWSAAASNEARSEKSMQGNWNGLLEQNEELRRRLQKSRAKSHERKCRAEQETRQLSEENAALRRECESLRSLFIRHQQQQIAFWTGPFMDMVAPSDMPPATAPFDSTRFEAGAFLACQAMPVPDENAQVPCGNIAADSESCLKLGTSSDAHPYLPSAKRGQESPADSDDDSSSPPTGRGQPNVDNQVWSDTSTDTII
mmetsp:Transcript_38147/g.89464  ORF Transcript_38147/g.89464 Transcript_38147/m.89464 type:complete len:736 (+) Transcript_38147:103-2310(+)